MEAIKYKSNKDYKKWYREHKEKIDKRKQEYKENHKKEQQEYSRRNYIKHNEKYKNKAKLRDKEKHRKFKFILKDLKINGCAICKNNIALEFHHVNPVDKKFNISQGASRSNEVLSDELNKCILLCQICHNKIEFKEKHKEKGHNYLLTFLHLRHF